MKPLRRQVERVVRPIVASELSKNQMREELLSHLLSLYEHELARCNDETLAVSAALARFGEPEELRPQLQKSIPLVERVLWARLPLRNWANRRAGESVERHIWRTARWQIIWMSGFILLLALFVIAMTSQRKPRVDEPLIGPLLGMLGSVAVVNAAMVTVFPFACEYLRRLVDRWQETTGAPRYLTALKIAGVFALLAGVAGGSVGLVFAMFPAYLGISTMYPAAFGWVVSGAALLAIPLAALHVLQQRKSIRQFEDWDGTEPAPAELSAE